MQVTFYKNTSPKNKLDKSLESIKTVSCNAYEDFNITTNNIIVDNDDSLLVANYCYNQKTQRYYFIDDIVVKDGRRMVFSCRCDVLYSFKDKIRENGGIVSRQSTKANYYLNDSKYTIESRRQITSHKFPNEHFSMSGSYIIKILGGV